MSAALKQTGPEFDPSEHPHRRFNPLLESYVLVSPHRTKRPWNGQIDAPTLVDLPKHDEKCYLCPGNKRMGGEQNPDYSDTFVFPNDFPALLSPPLPQQPSSKPSQSPNLFQQEPVMGSCQVICFHPRHDLTLARMPADAIRAVLREWSRVYIEEGKKLRAVGDEGYVQFFENRGAMMGASAPHPHGQVWSLNYVPQEPATELKSLQAYRKQSSSGCACLLCDYATQEVSKKERVVVLDEVNGWVAVVPWWATWPFEIMVLPFKRHISSILDLSEDEAMGLSETLRKVMIRYDNLFTTSFPYSMGLHQAPLPPTSKDDPAHLHLHFYPPLLRSASVRKFLVGFEMMAEAQRDLTPEQAAQRLRDLDEVHYLEKLEHNGDAVREQRPSSQTTSATSSAAAKTGVLPLADYGSGSEDETELPLPPTKKQKRLPSLSAGFALGPPDDPSLHDGRTRTRPFVPGEYSGHVYLEVTPNRRLKEALQAATEYCQTLMPGRMLHSNNKLHISLTHPLPLRRSQLEPFKTALHGQISALGKFHVSIVGQMVGFQNSLAREGDVIRGRAFLAIRVGAGHDALETMLTKAIEPVLASLRLPAYHRNPIFHASIAWVLGDAIPLEVLRKVNDRFEDEVLRAQAGWEVEEVSIKISGYPLHAIPLGGDEPARRLR